MKPKNTYLFAAIGVVLTGASWASYHWLNFNEQPASGINEFGSLVRHANVLSATPDSAVQAVNANMSANNSPTQFDAAALGAKSLFVSKKVPVTMTPENEPENDNLALDEATVDKPRYSPEEAIEMMQKTLAEGEKRRPELIQPVANSGWKYDQPSQAELDNPAMYEAFEAKQSLKPVQVFTQTLKDIERVKQAIATRDLTAKQKREAEEAVSVWEAAREQLTATQPELVPTKN